MKQQIQMGNNAAGFTLVELMVALVIGLIIVLGAGQLFLMGKQSYDRVEELAHRQESLRYLADLISLDIRTASSVAGDGSTLILNYEIGVRANDPHCSGNDLGRVEYTLVGASLMIQVQCDTSGSYGPEALVENVANLRFDDDNPLYVEVTVGFEAVREEREENAAFSFVVARRETILSGF